MNEFEYRVVWHNQRGEENVIMQTNHFDKATAFVRQFEGSLAAGEHLVVERYPITPWQRLLTRTGGSI